MTTIIMISNNSSVIINNSRDNDDLEEENLKNVKRSQASPTSSAGSRDSFSPGFVPKSTKIRRNYKNSLSTLESSEDSELDLNQSSAASTLSSSTGNSSSTSGICANSITYFPSLDEEQLENLETSTPGSGQNKTHSLRFFVNPSSGKIDIKTSPVSKKVSSSASFRMIGGPGSDLNLNQRNYDTRSLDRRRKIPPPQPLVNSALVIKDKLTSSSTTTTAYYCTLRSTTRKPSQSNDNNVKICPVTSVRLDDENCVRKLVKSAADFEPEQQQQQKQQPENNKNKNENNEDTSDFTSDEDDLSHAEVLSDSSQATSTSVESLTGDSNLNSNIVLPTGWHRHPGSHRHPVFHVSHLGPLDEIVHDEGGQMPELEVEEHIYSTVMKPKRLSSVLRSSRILRRHTTYYHAKQFDSLPANGNLASKISHSSKPHVHSWHRHKQQQQVSSFLILVDTKCIWLPCQSSHTFTKY